MSDPVTHEIDLDRLEATMQKNHDWRVHERRRYESGQRTPNSAQDLLDDAKMDVDNLIARLRAAEARAEAAEAERDALRARVPTEDEIESLRSVVCDYFNATPKDVAALRALVARNTPKENPDRV